MANIQINQLPTAGAITGQELVPIQQNGVTVQTTTGAIAASPSQTQTFLTVGLQTTLPNSRYFSTGAGLGITDGGAQGAYTIAFNGTAASLEASGAGFVVKTAADTITPRSIAVSGAGVAIANGTGISGNPTISLSGLPLALANASGTGLLALGSGTTLSPVTLTGTSNQIGVTGGDGSATPTISLANNFVAPGTAGITLPNGTTAQRGATTGQIRYNTTTARFEGYYAGSWQTFGIGDGTITSVSGTTNQIDVSNVGSIATVAISANPIVPGNGGFVVPIGTTAQRNPSPTNGTLRYNSSLGLFEGYANGVWGAITTGSGVTSVATGTGLTGGPITSTGTISIANTAVTAAAYGSSYQVPTFTVNAQGQLTLASNTTIDAVTLTTGSITTTPSGANDIANKSYVDSVAQGLDAKASCVVATTVNLAALSGLLTIDGITVVAGDRVLVKNQTLTQNNGIYVAASSAWTRALDMDVWAEVPNAFTFIETGTTQADTGWVCTANQGGTIGVTAMPWTQFSGAGTYTAGTGLTLTGTQFSITNTAVTAAAYGSATAVGTFTVNAQGQLTLAGNTTITPAVGSITGLGTGVATALAVNTGSAGAFVVNGGALGTPSSGTVTNLTGTASININGTVGATTANTGDFTTLNSSGNTRLGGLSGNQSLQVNNVASAVNYAQIVGAVAGSPPTISAQGTDTNIALYYQAKGSGNQFFASNGGVQFGVGNTLNPVNYPYFYGSVSGNGVVMTAAGSDANISYSQSTKGTGNYNFYTGSFAANQVIISHTASAVNYLNLTGAATGAAPTLSAAGSDANIGLVLNGKGTGVVALGGSTAASSGVQVQPIASSVNYFTLQGSTTSQALAFAASGTDTNIGIGYNSKGGSGHLFNTHGLTLQFYISPTASAVNRIEVTGGTTGNAPQVIASGSDTNIDLKLTPKGTGSVTINATTAVTVPAGTTAQRPTGVTGMFRYNSTTAGFEGYNGTVWGAIGGGSNITTLGLWENASVIAANYTIGTGNNATSAGPITINSGVVVTVPSGSTWVIV